MRVVQLTDYGSPHAGSFVPMLDAALHGTRDRGWEPVVVLPSRARTRGWIDEFGERHGGAVMFAPDCGALGTARWLGRLADAGQGQTIIHTHWTRFDIQAAVLARRRHGVKVVWHFHTVLSDALKARSRNRIRFGVVGPSVSRMLCVAPHLADGIRARGAGREQVQYFPNGVDTRRFPGLANASERAAARAELGFGEEDAVLLHIGRDWHLKGGDTFLDAFERLRDRNVKALMVRGGETAKVEVGRRGLAPWVNVIEGTSDVRRLHATSDLMVATSRGEGMPFAVIEALSSGLPVVATDIPGHALPGGGPSGFAIAGTDAVSIERGVRSMLDRTPAQARIESASSHAWVCDQFGLGRWTERLLAVYDSVASKG